MTYIENYQKMVKIVIPGMPSLNVIIDKMQLKWKVVTWDGTGSEEIFLILEMYRTLWTSLTSTTSVYFVKLYFLYVTSNLNTSFLLLLWSPSTHWGSDTYAIILQFAGRTWECVPLISHGKITASRSQTPAGCVCTLQR